MGSGDRKWTETRSKGSGWRKKTEHLTDKTVHLSIIPKTQVKATGTAYFSFQVSVFHFSCGKESDRGDKVRLCGSEWEEQGLWECKSGEGPRESRRGEGPRE